MQQLAQRRMVRGPAAAGLGSGRHIAAAVRRPGGGSPRLRAIEEKRDTSGTESTGAPPRADESMDDTMRRLAELRRQQKEAPPSSQSGNIVQGALEEAQLITWPKPGKALLDTVLVLAIVAGTGAALFGVNVLLTDAFNWWYTR